MKNINILMIPVIALGLLGCTSTDTSQSCTTPEQTETLKITKGQSKKQDVIKIYGEPQNKEIDSSGIERWIYHDETNDSVQTMWVRTPVPEGILKIPNIEVTPETKVDGNETLQKIIFPPKGDDEPRMNRVVIFDGDTVKEMTYKIEQKI